MTAKIKNVLNLLMPPQHAKELRPVIDTPPILNLRPHANAKQILSKHFIECPVSQSA